MSRTYARVLLLVASTAFALLLPCTALRADASSPWGVAPSAALSFAPQAWANDMARAGVTAVRAFDDRPRGAGEAALIAAGLSVSGILAWTVGSELTLPVADLPGFSRYTAEHLAQYKQSVRHWEIWNEPPNGTRDRSPVSYGRVVAAAYDAAKSVDPGLQVGLCAKSAHISFLAESIDGGARGKYDFISLHPYETAGLLPQGWEGPFLGIVPSVRAMLREKDPARADVAVWFTEVGVEVAESGRSGVSEAVQADTLVKIYALGLAQGAARVHWFDPRDSEGKTHGLLRGDGSPRPAYHALASLTRNMGASPVYRGSAAPVPGSFGFLFAGAREGEDVLVTWSRTSTVRQLRLAAPVDIVDPRSGKQRRSAQLALSTPVLLVAKTDGPVAAAWRKAASQQRLPSWDGEAIEREVSLTAGQAPRGVHMIDAPKAKRLRGVSELDLSGTSGARFAVDPQFLSYETQPIRITAVVRGHGRGDPGFNLKYEYRGPIEAANEHGMISTNQWSSVRGTQPTTLSWTIEDARFVGKYGMNLAIDCDTAAHCDFSLLELRITKL